MPPDTVLLLLESHEAGPAYGGRRSPHWRSRRFTRSDMDLLGLRCYHESTASPQSHMSHVSSGHFWGLSLAHSCVGSSDRSLASRWIRHQPYPWKKNVGHLWGLRQQRAEAVGLTNHQTVHVIVTGEQQVSVTASEDGTQEERLRVPRSSWVAVRWITRCFSMLNRGKSISLTKQPGLLDRTLAVANVKSITRNSIRGSSVRYLQGGRSR